MGGGKRKQTIGKTKTEREKRESNKVIRRYEAT